MTCQSCGAPIEKGARFCASCGAEVISTCTSCGETLIPGARFCSACGTPVVSSSEQELDVERKVVSALFADLADFTAAASSADPEDVAARLEAFHAAVRADVERYGGRVEKLIGDGVFAIFGAPTAHEDDAERAVRAALRIQQTIEGLNESDGIGLVARVAVATGEAMVRLGGTTQDHEGVVGDVVNMAARLQQLAPAGNVLVDERTHGATHRVAVYVPTKPAIVKGKPEPLTVWIAKEIASRFGVGVEVDETTSFVGREDELRMMVDGFERTLSGLTAQLITVTGEPGVGKTRLVAELRRHLDHRPDLIWWRQGHCLAYGEGVSFWALGEIVKAHAGVLDGEPNSTVRAKIRSTAGDLFDGEEASWVGDKLLELIGVGDGESTREEQFSAWSRFLEAMAGVNPLVVVVDDLHWADHALVDFLDELVETVDNVPLLIVTTARPELFDAHPGWGGGKRNSTTIALGPLSDEDTAQLVAALADDVSESQLELNVRRSGGNPLYATELVRMTADCEELGTDELTVPETIHAVIASRIDLLAPQDKEVLQAASVVGKVFWSGAVRFAIDGADPDLDQVFRRLSRRELIRRSRRSSMRDQEEFSFWHDLVADVAYGQIPRQARRHMHESIGRWLEATAGDRLGEVAEILAHHFTEALELSRAIGDADPRLERSARRFLLEAARRTEHVNPDKAIGFCRRAIDLSQAASERAGALIDLAHLLVSTHGGADAIRVAEQAVAAAIEAGSIELEAIATTKLSRALWTTGRGDEREETVARTLELAEKLEPGPAVTTVLAQAVGALYLRGDHDRLDDLLERGLEMGRTYGPTDEYHNLLKWAGTYLAEIDDPRGLDYLRQALVASQESGNTVVYVSVANNLASFLLVSGMIDEALEVITNAMSLGYARGFTDAADFSRLTLQEIYWHVGRWRDMAEHFDHLIERHGAENYSGIGGHGWRATHAIQAGDPRAGGYISEHLRQAREVGDHQALVPSIADALELSRQREEFEEGRTALLEFEKLTEARRYYHQGIFMLMVTRFAVDSGDLGWLEEWIDRPDAAPDQPNLAFSRAEIARARGDHDEADRQFDIAATERAEAGSPWQEAIVLIHRANARIDRGDFETATALLDRAEPSLAMLGGSIYDQELIDSRTRLNT